MDNPAIDRAVQAVEKAYDVIVEKASQHEFTQEEVDTIVETFLEIDGLDRVDETRAIMELSQKLSEYMIGPHKRSLLGVQYGALRDLASLNFDEYIEYSKQVEKRLIGFLTEFNTLVEDKLKEKVLPTLQQKLTAQSLLKQIENSLDIEVQLPEE